LALKAHFTRASYDFFKYGGKTNASVSSYETRRDRYQFEKLARNPDPLTVLVAHLSANPNVWIGDISPNSDTCKEFVRRSSALAYSFKTDLGKIRESLDANLAVPGGQHPYLLSALIGHEVSLETVCILQSLYNFIPYWDEEILDPVIWPEQRMRIMKMMPFLEFDREKLKEVCSEQFD
jgi:hypothetical protein